MWLIGVLACHFCAVTGLSDCVPGIIFTETLRIVEIQWLRVFLPCLMQRHFQLTKPFRKEQSDIVVSEIMIIVSA
jgi:hypothetical protein